MSHSTTIKRQGDAAAIHDASGRKTSLYRAWMSMKERCSNPQNRSYPNYGGRGIVVCAEWKRSFRAFADYVGQRPSPEHSLDRINNDRGYEPGNIRWATRIEQQNNKTNNVRLTFGDTTRPICEWARLMGITAATIRRRLERGLTVAEALTRPLAPNAIARRKSSRAA